MTRRRICQEEAAVFSLRIVSVLFVALSPALGCGGKNATAPPNILVIVADDLGWGDVGYHGGDIPTPNIDRLAAEGVELDRFYTQPHCTATRVGLFTGRSAIRFGMQYHPVTPGSRIGLASSEFNIAKAFVAAGYSSALLGKWHLGYADPDFLPNRHGFQRFYGHLMGGLDYFEHHFPAGGHDWQRDGVSVHEPGYSTFLLGKEAISLIRGGAKHPFFLMLSFNAPHIPIQAPEDLLQEYAHLEGAARRTYAAVVGAMDQTIGAVLEALDEEGISEQTIVFFLSDNGGFQRYASNAPLRGGKRSVVEGGIRVVAAVRWPGMLEPGKSDHFLSHLDVLPTLASAAGIDLPPTAARRLDGRDMWQAIRAGAQIEREPFFFGVDSPRANGDVRLAAIDRGKKLIQVRRADGSRVERLYDIVNDPGESRDLAAEWPERVAELSAGIDAWTALHPARGLRYLGRGPAIRLPEDFNILDAREEATSSP